MKIKFLFLALVALAICSCNQFGALPGMWNGTPVSIGSQGRAGSTAIITMEFLDNADNTRSGAVVLSARVDMDGATVPQFDGMVVSYALSATASAMISGTYSIVDDDDMLITLDPASLEVEVDPAAVKYRPGTFANEQLSIVDSLMPDAAQYLAAVVRPQISKEFYKFSKLDDIKIKDDSMMTFEIGDTDYIFHKKPSQPL